ncbi:MAG: hypothetical protein E7632_10635 [Ruminococcaceae bacterium]|nr:hypothetical protein [Oscillospiraceae bacterium]
MTSAEVLTPDEINRENAELMLPELDFGEQTINVLYSNTTVDKQDVYAEQTGDVVDEAVYARNLWIEETLNIKWNPIQGEDTTKATADKLWPTILAGEDYCDLAAVHQGYTVRHVAEGYFTNMADAPYINWEMPWWNLEYMNELAVGDTTRYFLMGDISLMRIKSLACVYYNKELCETIYGDKDYMYDIVLDGKWTFDKFAEMTAEAYADLNGNTVADKGDRFGSFASAGKSVEHFFYASGVESTSKNGNGIPELTMNNEKTISFCEKVYKYYNENIGMTWAKDDAFPTEVAAFISGEYLFAPLWFRQADELREMTTDYGIINFPKYDEKAEYRTLVHDGTTIYIVPKTSDKKEIVSAVCEAMALYNYKYVTPAYFEVAMKVKYTRDDKSSQILDMIADSAYTDFGYAYYPILGGSICSYRSFVSSKSNDFASWYAKSSEAVIQGIADLADLYLKME